MVALDRCRSVMECVEAAAQCDLVVGAWNSGLVQLCYAVGVPVFLITGQMDLEAGFKWHGDRHATYCSDVDELILKARFFLGLGG